MANADAAFGFRPVNADGGVFTGQTRLCAIVATATTTAVFVGDAVKMDTANAVAGGYQAVDIATGGEPVYGVVTSFEADPTNLENKHRAASTLRRCQVALADRGYFVVQDAGNIGLAGVGLNAAFVSTAGSTVDGYSRAEITAATVANTGDVQIIGGYDAPDNDLTASNALWIVKFNDPQTKPVRTGT
ncbi:MAG: hypothetical protein ACYSP9_08265 [Planctomycetota bacterium]|jgi:hypothetical protein